MNEKPRSTDPSTGTSADDIYGTTSPGSTGSESTGPDVGRDRAGEWLAQLQAMIDNVATHAGPVARQIGAKAAELAAIAGEKAGPIAHKAAEVTEAAGQKVAERGRDLAADLRRDAATDGQGTGTSHTGTAIAAPDDTTFGTSTTKDTPRE
jgi:hypothetical protein